MKYSSIQQWDIIEEAESIMALLHHQEKANSQNNYLKAETQVFSLKFSFYRKNNVF